MSRGAFYTRNYRNFEAEGSRFSMEVHRVAVTLFDQAHQNLAREQHRVDEEFESGLANASGRQEEVRVIADAASEECVLDDRGAAIGAATLSYICSALRWTLRSMVEYFPYTDPLSRQNYSGKNWLTRIREEFLERFNVDIGNSPVPLERIEEMFLARNAGIHWDGDAISEYLRKISAPRFVDEFGEFAVTRERLMESIRETGLFVEWVHGQLTQFWNLHAEKAKK